MLLFCTLYSISMLSICLFLNKFLHTIRLNCSRTSLPFLRLDQKDSIRISLELQCYQVVFSVNDLLAGYIRHKGRSAIKQKYELLSDSSRIIYLILIVRRCKYIFMSEQLHNHIKIYGICISRDLRNGVTYNLSYDKNTFERKRSPVKNASRWCSNCSRKQLNYFRISNLEVSLSKNLWSLEGFTF